MDKNRLKYWLNNKEEFRKEISKCANANDLYKFLSEISSIHGYKLFAHNKWDIPFENVVMYNDGKIYLQFYLSGGRKYKTINGFSRKIELCKCDPYDNFGVQMY